MANVLTNSNDYSCHTSAGESLGFSDTVCVVEPSPEVAPNPDCKPKDLHQC